MDFIHLDSAAVGLSLRRTTKLESALVVVNNKWRKTCPRTTYVPRITSISWRASMRGANSALHDRTPRLATTEAGKGGQAPQLLRLARFQFTIRRLQVSMPRRICDLVFQGPMAHALCLLWHASRMSLSRGCFAVCSATGVGRVGLETSFLSPYNVVLH